MHPSPADVRTWFAHSQGGPTTHAHLHTLRGDPNWSVLYPSQLPLDTLTLVYMPTGERLHLQRSGAVAHPSWQAVVAPNA